VLPKDYKVITVDCRELAPPEPMIKVLEAVERLGPEEAVLMLHRKRPAPLLSRLEEQGLAYSLKERENGDTELLIWRAP